MLFDEYGRFIFFDGAMGTMLQKRGLKPGRRPDIMNITSPEAVENVHSMYVQAGSDIICTNTFGANALALSETGHSVQEVITAAVSAAKRACGGTNVKIALDIGPVGYLLEPLGELTFDRAYELFKEQAIYGQNAGADMVAVETMSDLNEIRAAIFAVVENTTLPVMATMTFGENGYTFTGTSPEDFAREAQSAGACAVGLNCSLEPVQMYDTARAIADSTDLPLIIKPNAGLPDSNGLYSLAPAEFAWQMTWFAQLNSAQMIVGGCCGTTPDYIKALREAFAKL